jgi:cytochrome c biogenesis protein CcmG/thiol:disulfide interchange protein DsbE
MAPGWEPVFPRYPATKGNLMASMSAAESDEAREREAAAAGADALNVDSNDDDERPYQPGVFRTRVVPVFAIVMVVGMLGLLAYSMFAPEDVRLAPQGRINSSGVLVLEDRRDAPDFEVTSFSGDPLRLSELRGQVVVLNFWASWCPPCRDETPLLEAAQDNLGDDVVLVGMDIWDAEDDARDFLEQYGVTYTVGHDGSGSVAVDYGVSGVPETFVIDAQGRIVARLPGEVRSLDQLRGMVAEAR